MKLRNFLHITAIAFAVSGCVTTYQPHGITGGFTDTKIDAYTWRVKFDGNGYAKKEMIWNYWIYRCAALTIEKGFDGMAIETPKKASPATQTNPPPVSQVSPPFIQLAATAFNDTASVGPTVFTGSDKWSMVKGPFIPSASDSQNFERVKGGGYYYVPGGTYTVTTWHADGIVHMFNESSIPAGATGWLRASKIIELLKPYVDSDGKALAPSKEYILSQAMVTAIPARAF